VTLPSAKDTDAGQITKGPFFLGINCAHDAAACIVGDSGILAAVREERLVRTKHYEGFPRRSIQYCLNAVNLPSLRGVSGATINQYPKMDCEYDLRAMGYGGPLSVNPSHHLLHAFYARYFTGGRDGLIVIVDGSGYSFAEYLRGEGEMLGEEVPDGDADEAEAVFLVKDGALFLIHKRWGVWKASMPYFRFPSLGHAYAMAAQHIYQDIRGWQYAGKVMGLAPYGRVSDRIPQVIRLGNKGFEIDLEWVWRLPKLRPRTDYWADLDRQDIAARIQHDLEIALLAWLERLSHKHEAAPLCLTGGVAHNSVVNGKIAQVYRTSRFTPAADDAGTAIGGALYAFERTMQRQPVIGYGDEFHGRPYSTEEIEHALKGDRRIQLAYFDTEESLAKDAAIRLSQGAFIAVHDGGSEFSARALGHRSILCDPRSPTAKDDLNRHIKFREEFRPYAAMVLAEEAHAYFHLQGDSPYMMVVADVVLDQRAAIPAVCHIDGTARVQTIDRSYRGITAKILSAFHRLTGMPVLLNTSFNVRGEPIVETPEEALECLCTTGLDAVYISPYRVETHSVSWDLNDPSMRTYIPVVNQSFRLGSTYITHGTAGWSADHHIQSRTGHRISVPADLFEFLRNIDGSRTVGTLISETADGLQAMEMLRSLNRMGAVSLTTAMDVSDSDS